MSFKKPETRKSESGAEKQLGNIVRPMAVREPTQEERIEALELQNKLMKEALNFLYKQHYRKDAV